MVFLSGSKPLGLAQAANPQGGAAYTIAAPRPATLGVTWATGEGPRPACTRIRGGRCLRHYDLSCRAHDHRSALNKYTATPHSFNSETAQHAHRITPTQCICLRPKRQRSSQQRLIRNAAQQLRPPRVGQQIGASHHENSKANSQRNAKANRRPRTRDQVSAQYAR